jgi:FSR family fosmidomycin resistance protein-like MFS transporter
LTAEVVYSRNNERRALGVASGAHALFDGFSDLLYVLLPIWQAEFGLSYAQVGMLRGLFSGAMASFQIPASYAADRVGVRTMLTFAAAVGGAAYCLAGASVGFSSLIATLFLGGLAASIQHPVASALVARAYEGTRSRRALGTYNFAGDIGKMAFPAFTSVLLVLMPWRPTIALIGLFGIFASALIYKFTPALADTHATKEENNAAIRPSTRSGFPLLLSIGVLDSATRMAFLTFLPFLLKMKGADLPTIGFALLLVFAGGAMGKLGCAYLGARLGTMGTVCVTEGFTALGILALLPLSLWSCLALLPLIGFALNGTSSVLYGSVPDMVAPENRQRAFGIFYTGTIGSGALSPALYGLIGDQLGISTTLAVVAFAVLLTLPLAILLRPAFTDLRAA